MRKLKLYLIGFLIGVFCSVSMVELIHRTVEVERKDTCSIIYDALARQWQPDFVYSVKLTYKFFAWPVKTIHVLVSHRQAAVLTEGESEWQFAPAP